MIINFPFSKAPSWFTCMITDLYLDEFHDVMKQDKKLFDRQSREMLLAVSETFFKEKGYNAWVEENQLWFAIDANNPKYTFYALKYE